MLSPSALSPRQLLWRHPAWLVIGLLAATLAVTVPVEQHRLHLSEADAQATALRASNLLAERDSTRDVALTDAKAAALLGDSLRLVQKRVVQIAQNSDEVDRALDGERLARYALAATVDSLRASRVLRPMRTAFDRRRSPCRRRRGPASGWHNWNSRLSCSRRRPREVRAGRASRSTG